MLYIESNVIHREHARIINKRRQAQMFVSKVAYCTVHIQLMRTRPNHLHWCDQEKELPPHSRKAVRWLAFL